MMPNNLSASRFAVEPGEVAIPPFTFTHVCVCSVGAQRGAGKCSRTRRVVDKTGKDIRRMESGNIAEAWLQLDAVSFPGRIGAMAMAT